MKILCIDIEILELHYNDICELHFIGMDISYLQSLFQQKSCFWCGEINYRISLTDNAFIFLTTNHSTRNLFPLFWHYLFETFYWLVHNLLLDHNLLFMNCSFFFYDMFMTSSSCSQFFHDLYMTCSWLSHYLFKTWAWLNYLLITCSWIIHCFIITRFLFVHTLLPVFHDSFMNCCQTPLQLESPNSTSVGGSRGWLCFSWKKRK